MTLSDFSIRRPVFAWMIMIGLIVFGSICFWDLGISQMPDVDFPVLTVAVRWTGASPEVMELTVADVVESSVMSVPGIQSLSSACQEGLSTTTIEFDLNRDIDVAFQEVQAKLAEAQILLPLDIDPPIVTKSNPEDDPIVWGSMSHSGKFRDQVLFVRDQLKDRMTTISGVGDISLGGYVDPNMRVWLHANKMKANQISVDDVIAAIHGGNSLTPTGYIENSSLETSVRVLSEANTEKSIQDLFILGRSNSPVWSPIRIGDVASVSEGLADVRRISRLNGERAVAFGIIKQRGSNAVAVANSIKKTIASLVDLLPKGMKLNLVYNSAQFIENSTHELLFTLTLSAILTSVVCWLFLGSWSSALNVTLAIPTSLIGTFIAFTFFQFTLNTITLLALSLSIGIVVDDAIMVLENIVHHQEKGLSRVKAALVGAREITGAAVASSVAILAVFSPVLFMKGIIGKFFYQFGIIMSVSVMISLLEALTLAPMRCSQFLNTKNKTKISQWMDYSLEKMAHWYRKKLKFCLKYRWTTLTASLGIFALSLFSLQSVKKELVPPQDQNRFLLLLQTEMGSSMEFTDRAFQKAELVLKARPEIELFFSTVGGIQGGLVNQGSFFVTLKDPAERSITPPFQHRPSQNEVMDLVREEIKKIPEFRRVTGLDLSLSSFSSKRGYPVQFTVQGSNWEKLAENSLKMMAAMKDSHLMNDIDTNYNPIMPQVQVIPDRQKAGERGVSVGNIANTISALFGSLKVGKYTSASGHRDDIRVKLLDQFNRTPTDITKIWIRNNRGEMISLSDVVTLKKNFSVLTVSRYNREKAISIFANVVPGQSQAAAMDFVTKTAKEILPPGYHISFSGNSQAFQESYQSMILALVLGVLVAYMVLGAQFNSFVHPISILLALPFSATGAFLALWITGVSLNIYSMIGILLLMGIVKKNSILLVDFTNIRRRAGVAILPALLEACPLRLRPILMTSIATIAAAIPAALAVGPGSETTRPMAVVVIGGVLFSTLLTLFVVPCAYSVLARFENHKHQAALDEALAI